jgi:NAD(P)-dependent dehydrogenase (short-subunit alcohol dehydrogenase family)
VDISLTGLEQTRSLIAKGVPSVQITLCATDITIEAQVESMVEKCVAAHGRIDFASNNARIGTTNTKTADMTVEQFDRICNVKEKGVSLFLFQVMRGIS